MTEPTPQEEDASSLVPSLLAIYAAYLSYKSAHGDIPTSSTKVVLKLQLASFAGEVLALISARALTRQRAGRGPAADALWQGTSAGVRAGTDAGLCTIAEALIWTDEHEADEVGTKDIGGVVPTLASPPMELAMITAQATASAAQQATAQSAGWRYKVWQTQHDSRVRFTHSALDGVKVALDDVFRSPGGATLRYPGDPRAPIEERIGCRCGLLTSR